MVSPTSVRTISYWRLSSFASNFIQPDLSTSIKNWNTLVSMHGICKTKLSANHVSVNNIPRIIAYCPPNIIVQYFDASWKTCILKNNLNDVIFRRTNMYSCVNIFMVKNVTNVYKLSHVQGWESNMENWKFWLGLALPFLEIQLRLIICFFTAHLSNWQN